MTRRQARQTRTRRAPDRLIVPAFPGVDPHMWTELPPAAYPPQVAELIRGVLDARQTGEIVTVNGWLCRTCRRTFVARDLHPGVVPAHADHRAFEPATLCPGLASSLDYPRHVELGAPEFEWYRPSETELLGLDGKWIDHVLRGGLLLRRIEARP